MNRHPPSPRPARAAHCARVRPRRRGRPGHAGRHAQAFEFDTGNPDLTVRWDNTRARQPRLARRAARRHDRQHPDRRRRHLQLRPRRHGRQAPRLAQRTRHRLPEALRRAHQRHGWYDGAYGDTSKSNPPAAVNIAELHRQRVQRLHQAPVPRRPGEFLDAFVFGRFDLGDVPLTVKLGRHRCTGASRCSSAATSTASPTRRTRSTCRRVLPPRASRPRNCSAR